MSKPIFSYSSPSNQPDGDESADLVGYANLALEHARELADSAIPAAVAADQGVHTAYARDELPDWAQWIADRHGDDPFPALVCPMVHPDGSETGQVKPAPGSVTGREGHVLKYVGPGKDGNPPKLPVLRAVPNPEAVLVVEGVKQALAALAWAPDSWSIYRIAGIWSWRVSGDGEDDPGAPTPHLAVVQGKDVVIVPDADAETNIRVFDGATALGEACKSYGATSVRYVRLPGAGKDGLDDVLARLADDDARRSMLRSWVAAAKARPADLDKRTLDRLRAEAAKKSAARKAEREVIDEADGRPIIDVGDDPRQASIELFTALSERRGGDTIYRQSGGMVRLRRDEGGALKAEKLLLPGLRRELLDVACPVLVVRGITNRVGLSNEMVGVVADHWDELPRISGITRSPVVRDDGTILTRNGYDPKTGLVLDLTPDVRGIEVPEHPTDADIADSRTLIRDDFLAMDGAGGYDGWVFKDVSDQTNAVAALITPLVRAQTGPAPLMLYNGITPGVGKGGLVNSTHRIAFGVPAPMSATPQSDTEMDKRITAQLEEGADAIVLDEVQDERTGRCYLDSPPLRAGLTSDFYRGRELGKSRSLCPPNLATWFGAGNNVQLPRDMARRAVPIRLDSDRPHLENRSNFRHDLDTWVPKHRAELLRACLILVRAWFDRGQPEAPRDFGFASFTGWQRILGGILHLAGFEGFLDNVLEVRASTDSEAVDNREHWEWVASVFAVAARFGAGGVIAQAKADPDSPPPYGRSWDELDARSLSMYYGQHRGWYGDLRIREDGKLHGKGKAFVIEQLPTGVTPIPSGATASSTASPASGPRPAAGASQGEVVEFTDRKGFTQRVARAMPPMTGKTIAEVGGDAS